MSTSCLSNSQDPFGGEKLIWNDGCKQLSMDSSYDKRQTRIERPKCCKSKRRKMTHRRFDIFQNCLGYSTEFCVVI